METMNQFEDEEQWLGKAAIVGMSCRFPGATNVRGYWANLLEGVESVERFDPAHAVRSRYAPDDLSEGGVVGAEAVMPDVHAFDYELFGYTLGEARRLDPQMRIALQCTHEALEDAGCAGMTAGDGKVGVFFSASMSTYLLEHLLEENIDGLGALLGNDKDHIATTIAYRLGLTGTAVSVGSGCSSSAAALHFACLALATYQCDIAVVGGASILFPQRQGHVYREGGVYSKDGHCRPFSADASGTVGGSGVGVVVLRRLDDAVRSNHSMYCAVAGSACGNDGRRKVGYAAPSVEGQVETIRHALATAQADPQAFAFIEAHATGTALGDPIELDALHRAFGTNLERAPYCALGSVKANIGHLDTASGIASVIKAALCVSERIRPAQIGFSEGHPLIPWQTSPFHVVPTGGALFEREQARYVGVNSLGMGGTNVFVVLEPAPEPVQRPGQAMAAVPILLSAHRPDILDEVVKALQVFVQSHRPDLVDLAYTLSVGRTLHDHRAAFICKDVDDLLSQLVQGARRKVEEGELASRVNAWLSGESIDFSGLFPETSRRLHLPAYPYRRTECRLERGNEAAPASGRAMPNPSTTEHTYSARWQRVTGATGQRWPSGDIVLAFVDDATLRCGIERLSEQSQAQLVAVVRESSDALSPDDHLVSAGSEAHVRRAIEACMQRHGKIDRVVYAWTRPQPGDQPDEAISTSLGTLHWTARILDQLQPDKDIEWLVISRGLFRIAGDETLQASQSLAYDMSKMIELEYPQFHMRHVELPIAGELPPMFASACTCANASGTLAVRGRYLWEPYYAPVSIAQGEPDLDGAVLVLVGGLGGIGLTVAQALVSRFAIHLVIVHRAQWLDHPVSQDDERQVVIRRQLDTIRARASSLLLEQLDCNDRDAMLAAARRIGEHHGKVDGVLYLAGEVDREGVLRNRSFSMLERSVRTKTQGVANVTEAFAHLRPAFHVNFSSIGAVLHKAKFGEAGYVIGNGYLNAHARAQAANAECRFICINWTDWQTDGMWAQAQKEFQARYTLSDVSRDNATGTWSDSQWLQSLSAGQGVDLLLRIIAGDHEEVVVCAQDLTSLLEYQRHATHADYGRYLNSLKLSAAVHTSSQQSEVAFASRDTAQSLAQIWEELLGVPVQGGDDNFYNAGGDSLLALRLVALVKQAHGIDLSLSILLDTLTFDALVACIDGKIAEKPSSSEVSIEL